MPHPVFTLRSLGTALLLTLVLVVGCDSGAPTEEISEDPPPVDSTAWVGDAVIYEMFVPDFSEEGTFEGAVERFHHLEELGINTIWLMPIHPIGEERAKTDIGPLGSPYSIRDYYTVNPNYGSEEDFRAFVNAAHDRDMRVIIDLVANHTAWDHPWLQEHPEWYEDGPIDGFTVPVMDGDTTDWTDVVQLDYDNPELRDEMIAMMQYWVREFNIDGYRADVAGLVPNDFWTRAIDSLEAVKDPVFMLAEDAGSEMHRAGFDLTYAWPFYGEMVQTWEEEHSLSELVETIKSVEEELPSSALRMRFSTNHDETSWDAPPPAIFGGREGSQTAFVFATTLPGVPLIYNGQELGVKDTVSFFEATPYNWDMAPDSTLMPFYTEYMNFYTSSDALQGGALDILTASSEDALLYRRVSDAEELLIAINVRDAEVSIDLPEEHQGRTWTSVFSNETVTPSTFDLAPYEHRILQAEE